MPTKTSTRRRPQSAAHRQVPDRSHNVRRRRATGAAIGGLVLAGLVVGLVVGLGGGISPYRQTVMHLDWSPPHSRTVNGHVYRLVEAPTTGRELVAAKTAVAAYATSAWCHPVTAGLDPSDPSIEGALPAGVPLVRQLQAARTQATTPTSTRGATQDLVRLPAAAPARSTDRWCTWVGDYPRVIAATGGHLNPTPGLAHPAYPAYYGKVVQEDVPVDIEYGWTDGAGRGVHAWASGNLTFVRDAGGHLAPSSWTLRSWWSSTTPVPGPQYLPAGFHWNYAGEPIGNGVSAPAGRVPAS